MKKLLLVIDMVNGFVKEGALADTYINRITPNIINLIKEYKENNYDIISIQEGHSNNSKEFEDFPPHCILGTEEAELIDELKPYEKDMKIFRKNSTCGFVTKELFEYLKKNENETKEIVLTRMLHRYMCIKLCFATKSIYKRIQFANKSNNI